MLSVVSAHAATGVDTFTLYIPPNATMYVGPTVQMSVMSNVINSGTFGTLKGATVNMFGDLWRNTAGSSFPDETGINSFTGVGGTFRFAGSLPQYISGGFSVAARNGVSFPGLTVSNTLGIYLEENADAQIRNTLQFEKGVLWLNGNNLLVGASNPGSITGYTENNFVGTGNSITGGFLYRAKVSSASGSVVFPIGTQVGSYAPVSIMYNASAGQDLHMRVFDDVYSNATVGTKGNTNSLQQTWNIGQEDNSVVPSIIALQHNSAREGAAFTAHRGNSFVSQYDFTAKAWDTLPPSGVINPGTITTGPKQGSTYINTRTFATTLGQSNYLTKMADKRTDSITLAKLALTPTRQPDGSFIVTYQFLVSNAGSVPVTNIQVFDTIDHVFKAPATFAVTSVTATGGLVADKIFDGVKVTDLLLPASTVAARTVDTITLVLSVMPNIKDGYYYNTANITGMLNGSNNTHYTFTNPSVNGLTPPAPGTPSVPTPVALSASKYLMPEGFSPNGDGVNDKLVIGNLGNSNAQVWILNKQGITVYKNLNYHNDWDGSYNQSQGGAFSYQKVEDGTYFYKIIITEPATGKQETFYGYISIWK